MANRSSTRLATVRERAHAWELSAPTGVVGGCSEGDDGHARASLAKRMQFQIVFSQSQRARARRRR
eukprot:6204978-Pleurochrysis_carterae.AAC.1